MELAGGGIEMQTPVRRRICGRRAELAELQALLRRAGEGRESAAMVEGEAGIGKTRLVHEISEEAAGQGFEVYVGRAEELERSRPFAAVALAFAAFRGRIDDIVWDKAIIGDRPARPEISPSHARAAEAIADLLEERALGGPTLLCLEDLHWADTATLLFVRVVTRRLQGLPLGVIVTFRPPQEAPELAGLVDRLVTEGVPLVRLGPLASDEVDDVVEQALGGKPGPRLSKEVGRAGGNPFLALELASALDEEGAIVRTESTVEIEGSLLPPSIRLTILRRLSILPEETLADLRLSSVVGSTFSIDDLLLLVDKSIDGLFRSLEPALRSGVLREEGERLAFRHDLVHAALYQDTPEAWRKRYHRRLGEAMGAAGRPITSVATHMAMGAEGPDLQTYAWLAIAATCVGSASAALPFLRRAIELAPPGAPDLEWVRVREAMSLSVLGAQRSGEAETLARELMEKGSTASVRYDARGVLALSLIHLGRLPETIEQLRILSEDTSAPVEARAEHLAHLGQSLAWLGDVEGAKRAASDAIDLAGTDAAVMSFASMVLGFVATAVGDVAGAIHHGRAAVEASARLPYSPGMPPYGLAGALALLSVGDIGGAEEQASTAARRSEEIGAAYPPVYQRALAGVRYIAGRWDDAAVDARASVQTGDEPPMGRLGAYAIPARIHVHRAELDAARELIAAGESEIGRGDLIAADLLFWAKATLLSAEGDDDGALDVLERVWLLMSSVRYMFGMWQLIWPDLVKLAVGCARHDLADEVVRAAEVGAERAGNVAIAQAASKRIRGLAAADASLLADAAGIYESSPSRLWRAMAHEDAGTAYAKMAEKEEASRFLLVALEDYEALGATLDADRVLAALRTIGVRRGRRGARRRPTTGWEALTPTELRIVPLVSQGLTNAKIGERLFISRRTVETHLRNVFDKLGVSSRTEVVAIAARRPKRPGR